MLQIRAAQMFVFEHAAYRAWAKAVLPEVRRCWPSLAGQTDAALCERLHRAAREAARLGLVTRGQWLRYANVVLALGDDFAADAEARAILEKPSPPAARLEKIVRWAASTLRGR